jgi:glycosyltransferase involved in cell wall biosynthesis
VKQVNGQLGFGKIKPLVVAGIPAFNEERTIAKLVLETQKYVDAVLVCDDGSTDCTAEIAERMGADVIRHEKNMGYGAAIKTLFTMARDLNADVLITLDGDGQHDPQEIPHLVEHVLKDKADIVLGSRFLGSEENGVPRYRSWGIRLISRLAGAASNYNFHDAQCGFRVYGHKALNGINLVENGMGSSVEILMKAKKEGLTVAEVPAKCQYRELERTSTKNTNVNCQIGGRRKAINAVGITWNDFSLRWNGFRNMDAADIRCNPSDNNKRCIGGYSICSYRNVHIIHCNNTVCYF